MYYWANAMHGIVSPKWNCGVLTPASFTLLTSDTSSSHPASECDKERSSAVNRKSSVGKQLEGEQSFLQILRAGFNKWKVSHDGSTSLWWDLHGIMLIYNDGDEDVHGDFVEKCKFLHGVVNIALRYNQPSKTGPAHLKVTASKFLPISHISILPRSK